MPSQDRISTINIFVYEAAGLTLFNNSNDNKFLNISMVKNLSGKLHVTVASEQNKAC